MKGRPDARTEGVPPGRSEKLRAALLEHYCRHRRHLPWRDVSDPYRIMVSEVMLQQTRVETVIGYYEPWLERFPTLDALADADEGEVLKAWEGLGYYRRARNLQRAAQVVRDRPDGAWPRSLDGLRELPGVGEYTAGAVASIAFGEPVPAVDGNVRRVLSRLFEEPAPSAGWLRDTAQGLVPTRNPGDWNQALMELGQAICVPRSPRCSECPIATWCSARASGTQDAHPAPVRRAAPRRVTLVLAVLEADGRVMLQQRPQEGLLGGMWAFPELEVDAGGRGGDARRGGDAHRDASIGLAKGAGCVVAGAPASLPSVAHRFTHLHAVYLPWVVPIAVATPGDRRVWVDPDGSLDFAIPVAQQKVPTSLAHRSAVEV